MNPGDQPSRAVFSMAKEWPYVVAVVLAFILVGGNLVSGPPVQQGAPPAAPGPEEEKLAAVDLEPQLLLESWLGRLVLAFSLVSLAGGVVVLLWALQRTLKRQPLVQAQPAEEVGWTAWDVVKIGTLYLLVPPFLVPLLAALPRNMAFMLATFGAELTVAIVGLWVVLHDRRCRPRAVGLRLSRWRYAVTVAVAVFLGLRPVLFLVTLAQEAILRRLGVRWPVQDSIRMFMTAASPALPMVITLLAVVAAPPAEEFLFRGLLQGWLRGKVGCWPAIAAGATVFAVVHGNARAFAGIVVLGLALGFVYDRTRSLLASAVLHALFNGFEVLTFWAARSVT